MDDKIKKLLNQGYFTDPTIDEKGFGTFKIPLKPQSPTQNDYLNTARKLKKEADTKIKINKNDGILFYIKATFHYIKGYRSEENKLSKEIFISRYQGLYKYIYETYKMADESCPYINFLSLLMFIVKFHLIYLEAKGLENSKSKNILELYSLSKKIENLPNIDDLEDFFDNLYTSNN